MYLVLANTPKFASAFSTLTVLVTTIVALRHVETG